MKLMGEWDRRMDRKCGQFAVFWVYMWVGIDRRIID